MMSLNYDDLFDELCRELGFCSLGLEGQDRIIALGPVDLELITRAIFAEEGLDYDTYKPDRVRHEVRACVACHLNRES